MLEEAFSVAAVPDGSVSVADRYPDRPAAFVVSALPPLLLKHSWSLDQQVLSKRTQSLKQLARGGEHRGR